MNRFLRSFLVLSTSLKRSGERERDSVGIPPCSCRREVRCRPRGPSTCPRSASADRSSWSVLAHAGGLLHSTFTANRGAGREACFGLSWPAGAPHGGARRHTAPPAAG